MNLHQKGRPPKPKRENVISTSIRVDRGLWVKVKAQAAVRGITLDEYIEDILYNKLVENSS
jgi:predicted DNA binding CopG/RHH family protein